MNDSLPDVVVGPDGPEVVHASADLLGHLLEVLGGELVGFGIPIEDWLSPGADPSAVAENFQAVGLVLPAEVAVLYGWHDGSRKGGYGAIPRFPFEGYGRALANYRLRRDADELDEDESGFGAWGDPAGWLPLASDSYSLVVDCRGREAASPLVRATQPDFSGQRPLAQGRSLCTLVTWWIEGIRSGAHVWDGTNWKLEESKLPPLQREYRLT